MHSRREFLAGTLAGLTTAALSPLALAENLVPSQNSVPALGAELYTVRQLAEKDLPGTLAGVRKIGYRRLKPMGACTNGVRRIYAKPSSMPVCRCQADTLAIRTSTVDLNTRKHWACTI